MKFRFVLTFFTINLITTNITVFSMNNESEVSFFQFTFKLPIELQQKVTCILGALIKQSLQQRAEKFPRGIDLPKNTTHIALSPNIDKIACCTTRNSYNNVYMIDTKTALLENYTPGQKKYIKEVEIGEKNIIAIHQHEAKEIELYKKQKKYCTILLPECPSILKFCQNGDVLKIICNSQVFFYTTKGKFLSSLSHEDKLITCSDVAISLNKQLAATSVIENTEFGNIGKVYIWLLPDKPITISKPILCLSYKNRLLMNLLFSKNNLYITGKESEQGKIHAWNLDTQKHKSYKGHAINSSMNLIINYDPIPSVHIAKNNVVLQILHGGLAFAFSKDEALVATLGSLYLSLDLVNKRFLIKWLLAQKNIWFTLLISQLQKNECNIIEENSVLHNILMSIQLQEAQNFLIHCFNITIVEPTSKKIGVVQKIQKTQQYEQCTLS